MARPDRRCASSDAATGSSRRSTAPRPATRSTRRLVDALHALCAELEAEPRVLDPHRRRRRLRLGRRHRPAARAPRRRRARGHQHARRSAHPRACRCPSSRRSTARRSAAEPSSRTPPTSASGRPRPSIGNPETGLGIIAAAGATWRLPEIVGHARASELLLTGRILTPTRPSPGDSSRRCTSPTTCSRRRTRSPTASRRTTRSRPATPRRRCSRRADAHPAIELELQAELFESPRRCGA